MTNPRLRSRFARSALSVTALGAVAVVAWALNGPAAAADAAARMPPPAQAAPAMAAGQDVAVLSGGCFWGVQGVFQHVKGVKQVLSGYAGGTQAQADYETVSTGTTGHAESVRIVFDPSQISYGQILQVFFSVALDPTQVNRQGPDDGPQYRSEVFYTSDAQKQVAQAYIGQLNGAHVFSRPIATRIDALPAFYPAEAYHQDYLLHHPNSMYIVVNDMPKVEQLKKLFPELYRPDPVLSGPMLPGA